MSSPSPALTTLWDKFQQVARKLLGYGAGYLAGRQMIDDETVQMLIVLGMAGLDWIWFAIWNRNQVATVSGLEKAAQVSGSSTIQTAADIVAAKKV